MDGNLFIKIARAAYSIAERPHNFKSYLSSQFSTPLSLGLPWISYPAIDFLERYLRPEMDVFEFGSGGSTVYFSSRVGSVTAVEEDAKWATLVEAELKKRALRNASVLRSNWNSKAGPGGFLQSDYLTHLQSKFDIILIDGMCFHPSEPLRPFCFDKAKLHLKPNGIIVMDDSWRYKDLVNQDKWFSETIFKGLGPCRPGVTTTTIYSSKT